MVHMMPLEFIIGQLRRGSVLVVRFFAFLGNPKNFRDKKGGFSKNGVFFLENGVRVWYKGDGFNH